MKILIDIGHPGHVHYFKNLIKNLENDNHKVIVTARERDIVFHLLNVYKIPYVNRGKGKKTRVGKILYMLKADIKLLFLSLKLKPSLYISFSSPYAAQVAWLLRKPHIALNDTEHQVKDQSKFCFPFSKQIITPFNFHVDLGEKQVRLKNIFEGFYLHKNYYYPDGNIKEKLGLKSSDEYVILRFISWQAHHDYGQSGLDLETKRGLIKLLERKYKVFISSEEGLSDEFKPYKINIPPEKMHDILNSASMFVGESGTMASESSFLGTPAVYVNSLPLMCYLKLEQEYGILKHFKSSVGVLEYVETLINQKGIKEKAIEKSIQMKSDFIDPTAFLTWFISDYPSSSLMLKEKPEISDRFK